MAKGSRGLPPSFSLNVPDRVATRPMQLDDYLEEPKRVTPSPVKMQIHQRPTATALVAMHPSAEPFREALAAEHRLPFIERAEVDVQPRSTRAVPRKQLNMNPDTLRMVEELLEHIQRYSGQKDAKASEMFHALVTALYEARELLNLQNIPPRGRWGTPTARAFPVALKNAFQGAIAGWHRRNGGKLT